MTRFPILTIAALSVACCTARPVSNPSETIVCADQEEVIINGPKQQDGSQMQVRQTVCKVWMTPHGLMRVELAHPVVAAPAPEREAAPAPKRELEL